MMIATRVLMTAMAMTSCKLFKGTQIILRFFRVETAQEMNKKDFNGKRLSSVFCPMSPLNAARSTLIPLHDARGECARTGKGGGMCMYYV